MANRTLRRDPAGDGFIFSPSVESFSAVSPIDDCSRYDMDDSRIPSPVAQDGPHTAQTARAYQGRASLIVTTPKDSGRTSNSFPSDEKRRDRRSHLHQDSSETVVVPTPPQRVEAVPRREETPSLVSSWLSEFIWLAISLASLIVIIAVLRACDGQPLSRIPIHINAFVALFTTLATAAFMFPVAEAIGQWKWSWFQSDRPLADFETFDEASRGVWGSMFFVGRLRIRSLATLGAVVTILSAVTSPVTQLAIEYPSQLVASELTATTSAVRAWGYDSSKQPRRAINLDMQTAILQGFQAPIDGPLAPGPTTCATGDCSFPRFSSLGMCVQLANVTSHLNVTESGDPDPSRWNFNARMPRVSRDYAASLEGHCQIAGPSTIQAASCRLPTNASLGFAADAALMDSMVYSQVLVYSTPRDKAWFSASEDDPAPMRWHALEALYHLCAQTYEATSAQPVATSVARPQGAPPVLVDMNCTVPGQRPTAIQCNSTSDDWWTGPVSWMTLQDPEQQQGQGQGAAPETQHLRAQNTTLAALVSEMYQVATFQYLYSPRLDEDFLRGSLDVMRVVDALYGKPYTPLYLADPLSPETQLARVEALVGNVANSITSMMRTSPPWHGNDTAAPALNSFSVNGTATAPETFVRVRWGWLAFLVLEILLAAGFLAATVAHTRRTGVRAVLKSSPLATLVALGADCRAAVVGGGGTTNNNTADAASLLPAVRANARALPARFDGREIVLATGGDGGGAGLGDLESRHGRSRLGRGGGGGAASSSSRSRSDSGLATPLEAFALERVYVKAKE